MTKTEYILELEKFLKKDTKNNLEWLHYEKDKDSGEEYVHIYYTHGHHQLLNVTANSNACNCIEITKAIYY